MMQLSKITFLLRALTDDNVRCQEYKDNDNYVARLSVGSATLFISKAEYLYMTNLSYAVKLLELGLLKTKKGL